MRSLIHTLPSTIAALSMLILAGPTSATTRPRGGAVAKPADFDLRMPFPCGVRVRINCGYGPKCSKAHKRTQSKSSTPEYYALDLARDESRNGRGKAVVAAASGTVRIAGWARGGWAPYGKMVYIEHDYRDAKGHKYYTIYAHLHGVKVKVGQHVEAGEVLGTLGGSSRRKLFRYGPHLHFAVYRDSGRRLGGGRAVVPEPLGPHKNLRRRQRLMACGGPDRTTVAAAQDLQDRQARGGLE